MSRLSGLLLIVRAFVPLLMVLTIYWGYTRMIDSFRAAMSPMHVMEDEIAALGETVETARGQFGTARTIAEAAIATIQNFSVPNLLPNLGANLTIPSISIPDMTVPIVPTVSVTFSNATGSISRTIDGACRTVFNFLGIGNLVCDPVQTVTDSINIRYPSGITFGTTNFTIDLPSIPSFTIPTPPFFNTIANGLEGVFSSFDSIFGVFDETLASINTLGQEIRAISDSIGTIAQSGQQMLDNLRIRMSQRAGLVSVALIVVAVLLVYYFATGFVRNVLRGLRLLFGG